MRADTHKETVSHPVCDDEARVWNDDQGLGVHGKTPTNWTRGEGIRNAGEFTVVDVPQLLKPDVHGGEDGHQPKHDRRVSHQTPFDVFALAIKGAHKGGDSLKVQDDDHS